VVQWSNGLWNAVDLFGGSGFSGASIGRRSQGSTCVGPLSDALGHGHPPPSPLNLRDNSSGARSCTSVGTDLLAVLQVLKLEVQDGAMQPPQQQPLVVLRSHRPRARALVAPPPYATAVVGGRAEHLCRRSKLF